MVNQIERINELINNSNRIVFLGGAGVSVESGIPDFRSKDGLYNNVDKEFEGVEPEYLLSHSCFEIEPELFYSFYRKKMDTRGYEPNAAHKYLAALEKQGKLAAIVTQNIDGLHQKAGSRNVLEIHGTTSRCYCDSCGKRYPGDYIFKNTDKIPFCDCGGGRIRPAVTLYEENLPENTFIEAINEIEHADLLIVGGTSLKVQPAASLITHFYGDTIIVINKGGIEIQLGDSDIVVDNSIGTVFTKLAKMQGLEL